MGSAAFLVALGILVVFRLLAIYPWVDPRWDSYAYWATRFGLDYANAVPGEPGSYLYSPAFAQALVPLTVLPWPLFAAIWTALAALPLVWLAGRRAGLCFLVAPVAMSVAIGQLDLLFAAAIVAGFRFPAAWSLLLLTKVTPGIGVLWFVIRREWRQVWLAVAATVGIGAVSVALDPGGWNGWIDLVLHAPPPDADAGTFIHVPLAVRLPVAVAVLGWGALGDRRWVVPVAVVLAMPTIWFNSLAILVAVLPLTAMGRMAPASLWLARPGPATPPWPWPWLGPEPVPLVVSGRGGARSMG